MPPDDQDRPGLEIAPVSFDDKMVLAHVITHLGCINFKPDGTLEVFDSDGEIAGEKRRRCLSLVGLSEPLSQQESRP